MRREISGRIKNLIIKEMQPYGLEPFGIGGAELHGMITGIELVFNIDQLLDIESARKILVEATEKAIQIASSQKESSDFFTEIPVPKEIFSIGILGPEPEINDGKHIEAARCSGGEIVYNITNPDPRWDNYVHVHEETFEEARAIVRGGKPS
ncbi:MAG: hypothetical protein H7A36_04275 [Chlamydiales bacterium]|nr:hypothetical protein [Chlamydiales bacterium]